MEAKIVYRDKNQVVVKSVVSRLFYTHEDGLWRLTKNHDPAVGPRMQALLSRSLALVLSEPLSNL